LTDVDPEYVSAIAAHLDDQNETSLSHAYELGRSGLARGMGILDMFELYQAIHAELVLTESRDDQPRLAAAVGDFFRELLSPYEMSFRGYRDANDELRRMNADLQAAYAELKAKQLQLIQAAKMASLGELVAGIAHEINNPLAFVTSHLETANVSLGKVEAELGAEVPATAQASLERARHRIRQSAIGAERMRDLVLKLRTFSRLDEGERKEVSISECVASVLTILEHRFRDRVEVQVHAGEPDVIECFPSLLNQALMNLIANAIDAIADRGIIEVTWGRGDDAYVIVVSDTGHGIPEELRQRVLEPFFTTKPVGHGTGLGLSITYSIVQRHGGTLELSPREGGGTVATIRLPDPTTRSAQPGKG